MSFFSELKNIASDSAGRILWKNLQETLALLENLSENVQFAAISGFLDKRKKLLSAKDNMTSDGRIKMGKYLQGEARKSVDLNVSEGYSLWLAGAWLESKERSGIQAEMTYDLLENMATEFNAHDESEDQVTDFQIYDTWDEWYEEFKLEASKENSLLFLNDKGGSFIDFMDTEPLKRAFADGVDPKSLARGFAAQFDLSSMIDKNSKF